MITCLPISPRDTRKSYLKYWQKDGADEQAADSMRCLTMVLGIKRLRSASWVIVADEPGDKWLSSLKRIK